jgi:hypothetical protein
LGFRSRPESPNDEIQVLPEHNYKLLKGEQRDVFLQVMAYFKRMDLNGPGLKPPTLRINVDGTAGTGKSFLIWCITTALREHFGVDETELGAKDPAVRLAPTGISAFGIRGWTLNFGLGIPAKEKADFAQLLRTGLTGLQTRWQKVKLLIVDEKSMIGVPFWYIRAASSFAAENILAIVTPCEPLGVELQSHESLTSGICKVGPKTGSCADIGANGRQVCMTPIRSGDLADALLPLF